jgi:hypothetical protein
MFLTLGVLSSILIELFKWMTTKFGKTLSEGIILGGLFILVVLWTVLTQANIISENTVKFIVATFSVSITTYELVIKKLLAIIKDNKDI